MRRLLVIVTAVLLVGFTAASPAFAEPSPDPGTTACDLLVAADVRVAETTTALTIVRSDVSSTPEEIAAAEQAREDAVADAALALCLGADDPTTEPTPDPTTEPTPTEQPAADPTVDERVAAVLVKIAALDCTGFAEKLGDIRDDTFALVGQASGAQLGRLSDALNTKVAALGFCTGGEPTSTPTPTVTVDPTIVVRPTDDDDSTAVGTQVREVPEGSVATGSA